MESMKNAVSSAFGSSNNPEQHESNRNEPVSGQTGAGTASEPFDKGNEEANVTDEPSNTASSEPASSSAKAEDRPAETSDVPESQPTDSAKAEVENTTSSSSGNDPSADSRSGEARRPANEDERQEMAAKGELPKDPNDHSGEPMKMHDGSEHKESGEDNTDQAEGEKDEKGGNDESKGSGEKWVKSTGMAADGGDFDATKPGAGREANRLMEEKGIHKEDPSERGKLPVPTDTDDAAGKGSSPVDKLKEKLHIGTGSHGNQQAV